MIRNRASTATICVEGLAACTGLHSCRGACCSACCGLRPAVRHRQVPRAAPFSTSSVSGCLPAAALNGRKSRLSRLREPQPLHS